MRGRTGAGRPGRRSRRVMLRRHMPGSRAGRWRNHGREGQLGPGNARQGRCPGGVDPGAGFPADAKGVAQPTDGKGLLSETNAKGPGSAPDAKGLVGDAKGLVGTPRARRDADGKGLVGDAAPRASGDDVRSAAGCRRSAACSAGGTPRTGPAPPARGSTALTPVTRPLLPPRPGPRPHGRSRPVRRPARPGRHPPVRARPDHRQVAVRRPGGPGRQGPAGATRACPARWPWPRPARSSPPAPSSRSGLVGGDDGGAPAAQPAASSAPAVETSAEPTPEPTPEPPPFAGPRTVPITLTTTAFTPPPGFGPDPSLGSVGEVRPRTWELTGPCDGTGSCTVVHCRAPGDCRPPLDAVPTGTGEYVDHVDQPTGLAERVLLGRADHRDDHVPGVRAAGDAVGHGHLGGERRSRRCCPGPPGAASTSARSPSRRRDLASRRAGRPRRAGPVRGRAGVRGPGRRRPRGRRAGARSTGGRWVAGSTPATRTPRAATGAAWSPPTVRRPRW